MSRNSNHTDVSRVNYLKTNKKRPTRQKTVRLNVPGSTFRILSPSFSLKRRRSHHFYILICLRFIQNSTLLHPHPSPVNKDSLPSTILSNHTVSRCPQGSSPSITPLLLPPFRRRFTLLGLDPSLPRTVLHTQCNLLLPHERNRPHIPPSNRHSLRPTT